MKMSAVPFFLGNTPKTSSNLCSGSFLRRFEFGVGLEVGSVFEAVVGTLE